MNRNREDMKKTIDRKLRILYVMDYMRENSDEDHPVKLSDIQKAITDRGIYTTRKALYDDFEVLSDYGFEIIRVDGTYTYYYSNPLFEFAELKLMIDIIHESMGLIILVPISKNKLLVLFDQGVYSCDTSRFYVPSSDEDEVVHLNVLQLISANERVMAHSDTEFSFFDESAKSARVKNREAPPTRTFGDSDNKLIITSMRKCLYSHEWNFVKMIRKAKKIPFPCREAVYREWSPEWENKLEAKVHFMPSVMTSIPKGMTDKELVGGFQKMSSFAKEYWRNQSLHIENH